MRESIATMKRQVESCGLFLAVLLLVGGCSSGGGRSARVAPPPPQASPTQVSQPAEIRSLDLREEGEVAYLDVAADRPLVWTNYRDSLGNLVVELPNSLTAEGVGDLSQNGGLVASVEIERLDDAERPLTRLVVRTREDSEHSLTTEGSTLQLQLLPAGYEEQVALAYQPISESETGAAPEAALAAAVPVDSRRFGTADEPLSGPDPVGVQASRLISVDVREADQGTTVVVLGDGEFSYSTFRLTNPERFVVDLNGVVNTSAQSSLEVSGEVVDRVRVGQFKPRPGAVSRVVFDLRQATFPVIERSADGLSVWFGGPAPTGSVASMEPAAALDPPPPDPLPVDPMPVDVANTGDNRAEPLPPMPAAEAAEAAEAATSDNQEVTAADEVPLLEPMPTAVNADEGRTLVAELEEAELQESDFGGATPEQAPGESEPTASEPTASEPTASEVAGSDPAFTAPSPTPVVETADTGHEGESLPPVEPPVTRFEPTGDPLPTGEAMALAEERPAEPAPVETFRPAAIPPPPSSAPPPRPAPSVIRPTATGDVSLFEAQRIDGIDTQEEFAESGAPQFDSVVITRQTKQYSGELINMSLKDADLVETLRSFASISDLNFVIQPEVSGSVTVELKRVPWDQAMEQILKINNLGMAIDGTIIRIAPADDLRREAERDRETARARRRLIPLRTIMKTLSYATAIEVSSLLKNRTGAILSDRGTVQVDQRTNSLIIREIPGNIDTVLAVIENLDTPEPQVTIEARIIEATKTFSKTLGIRWGFDGLANNQLGNTTGLQFPNNYDVDGGVGLLTGGANGFLNLTMGNILNSFNLNASLQVAENEGLINIISAPSVTTLNNNPAFIQSGLQIPIQTVSNRTVSVQFVNATLSLIARPHVTAEGTIILQLNVAKRAPQLGFAIVGATNAPIATKEATTTVVVRDGGTAVIGGIYEVSTNQSQSRVPGLANIPILGHLFKNRARNEDNDELMIFVTPRIVQM